MLNLLNAGFGELLGDAHAQIADLGFDGVRTDVPADVEGIDAIINEQEKYDATSILLFNGGHMEWTPEFTREAVEHAALYIKSYDLLRYHKVFFEIGNEPDLARDFFKYNPAATNDMFWECYQTIKLICSDIEVITPAVSNLNERGLTYLAAFMVDSLPKDAIVGYHRYPADYYHTTPHKPFKNRDREMRGLQTFAKDHRLFCTETGMSQGPHHQPRDFPLCFIRDKHYKTVHEQYNDYLAEKAFNQRHDIMGMVWYQFNDGPNKNDFEDNFGVRYVDGRLKEPWN